MQALAAETVAPSPDAVIASINQAVTAAALLQRRLLNTPKAEAKTRTALQDARDEIVRPLISVVERICAKTSGSGAVVLTMPSGVLPFEIVQRLTGPERRKPCLKLVALRAFLVDQPRAPGYLGASGLELAPLVVVAAVALSAAIAAHEIRQVFSDPALVANAKIAQARAESVSDVLRDLRDAKITQAEADKRLTAITAQYRSTEPPPSSGPLRTVGLLAILGALAAVAVAVVPRVLRVARG